MDKIQLAELTTQIKTWGQSLGFQSLAISDTRLDMAETYLRAWLQQGRHGSMAWMAQHGDKRSRPAQLVPGTLRIITARLNYWPANARPAEATLRDPTAAYISRYALGRDYHKLLRQRLQKLASRIAEAIGPFGYRVFCDSAPVLEKAIAENAGLGWIGKHTNLIHREHGSYFFLAEIYTDLALPVDTPSQNHCGTCQACIEACPSAAITAPYQLDARRCISYLTIELHGAIPIELRPLIGNRIYGCDDCQLVCPWNRFAEPSREPDFSVRHRLDDVTLLELFQWDEATFLQRTEGSAIRRLGYIRWLRNIAVALGNAPPDPAIRRVLEGHRDHPEPLVREHVQWALVRQQQSRPDAALDHPARSG